MMDTWEEHPGAALHAYLDRQLSLEGMLLVEEHLTGCKLCRIELETLGALRRALRSTRSRAAR
jgi:anti-sigma factor RsiW